MTDKKDMEKEFRKFFKKYFVVVSQPQYVANNLYTEPTINLLMTFIQSAIHKTDKPKWKEMMCPMCNTRHAILKDEIRKTEKRMIEDIISTKNPFIKRGSSEQFLGAEEMKNAIFFNIKNHSKQV